MKLYVVITLLLSTMIQGAPTLPPKPTTQPKYIHPPLDDAPIINFNRPGDNWWRLLALEIAKRGGGVSIRNVLSIKIDGDEITEKFIPPQQNEPDFDIKRSNNQERRTSIAAPRALRMPGPTPTTRRPPPSLGRSGALADPNPEPLTGDIGVCSTLINAPSLTSTGKIYATGRTVSLRTPIAPHVVSCRSNVPIAGHGNGNCVVVGYPHGAWVIAKPEELIHHNPSNCKEIEGSQNKKCWDYINVPGYCVQLKRRRSNV